MSHETEQMRLTVTPVPMTMLSLPVPREKVLEAIVVFRTLDGVEVAGDLSDHTHNINLLLDGITRLQGIHATEHQAVLPPVAEDAERS